MDKCRVFILFRHSLFAEAINNVLASVQGIEVVGTDTDPERGMESIRALEPDVVVLETDEDHDALPGVTRMFWKDLGPKIVGVKLDSNELVIYQKRRHLVIKPEDLVEAIQRET